jgi:hypothetical protein
MAREKTWVLQQPDFPPTVHSLLYILLLLLLQVDVPVFHADGSIQIAQQTVPQLTKPTILKIQQAALAATSTDIQQTAAKIRSVGSSSGFVHPGTCLGPVEVAAMQHRVRNGVQPQLTAKEVLLTGGGWLEAGSCASCFNARVC